MSLWTRDKAEGPPLPKPSTVELFESLRALKGGQSIRLKAKQNTRSAAVAIVLRFANEQGIVDISSIKSQFSTKLFDRKMVEGVLKDGDWLEILYIKRSMDPRDRWSGHVAFPGGRQDENEELVRSAVREAQEEVGLELDNQSEYDYIGPLDDRYTMPIGIRAFLISSQVFIQLKQPSHPFKLDANEVSGCRWVNVYSFLNPDEEILKYPASLKPTSRRGSSVGKACVIGTLGFPGYHLPCEDYQTRDFLASNIPSETKFDYHLWGLTLDISDDLLSRLKLIRKNQISFLPICSNFLVRLSVLNHYYTPHSLKIILPLSILLFIILTIAYAIKKLM